MTKTRAALAAISWAAASVLLVGCAGGRSTDPKPAASDSPSLITLPAAQRGQIHAVEVTPTTFHLTVNTTGTVDFDGDQSTQVLAPMSGPVHRVLVEPGVHVSAGQPLATVASPDFAAAVADLRKSMAEAKNTRRIADLDEQLFQNDAIARRDMEQAQTDAISAAADLDAAKQALVALGADSAEIQALMSGRDTAPSEGVIRAPIGGTLVVKSITPGQLLSAGSTPCFTIADVSRMWVRGNIFESDLANVEKGDAVDVTSNAFPETFHGRIDYVADLIDPNTRATSVRVTVPNPRHRLRQGMYVNVAIHSSRQRTGLLVPVSAVERDEDNTPFVFVAANEPGAFERRTVTLGPRVGDRYEIASGLRSGDRVVSEGELFLQFALTQ